MNYDLMERRHAITAWRDELVLEIWKTANGAAAKARQAIENELSRAGFVNSIWDPDDFVHQRVDDATRTTLLPDLEALFARAGEDLKAIHEDHTALAAALADSLAHLHLPEQQPPAPPPEDTSPPVAEPVQPIPNSRLSALVSAVTDREVVKSARDWGSWALDKVSEASDVASQKLQSGTGLHDRLRRSASERVTNVWMGTHGEQKPVMGQLLAVVEEVTNAARSMAQ